MKHKYKAIITVLIVIIIAIFSFVTFGKSVIYSAVLKETSISTQSRKEKSKSTTIKKNDYILFGKYQNEPILWQVLNVDKKGKALLMSKYILCLKAFDASGKDKKYHNGSDLSTLGSSDWKNSTIRQWLNSDKDKVIYSHCPPSKSNVNKGYNAYDSESGFLSNSNFGPQLLSLIYDKGDKVFLLSKSELSKYFKPTQRKKQCTKSAILSTNSPYLIFSSQNIWYWTSSKISTNRTSVCTVTSSGNYYKALAYDGATGVCPALYLKSSEITTIGGNGSKSNPYWISNRGA